MYCYLQKGESLVKVLIDFLTIIKYRKKDINKISSEHVEMLYKR
jgi:hypothetical protein